MRDALTWSHLGILTLIGFVISAGLAGAVELVKRRMEPGHRRRLWSRFGGLPLGVLVSMCLFSPTVFLVVRGLDAVETAPYSLTWLAMGAVAGLISWAVSGKCFDAVDVLWPTLIDAIGSRIDKTVGG